jgi:hypothetical protein
VIPSVTLREPENTTGPITVNGLDPDIIKDPVIVNEPELLGCRDPEDPAGPVAPGCPAGPKVATVMTEVMGWVTFTEVPLPISVITICLSVLTRFTSLASWEIYT